MTVAEIVKVLDIKVFSGELGLCKEVKGGYTSDLLSDVMGNANAESIWITLQTHINVMAIASLKELSAIILVKGLQPEPNTLEQSNLEGIPILGTTLDTFEITGQVYNLLLGNQE